MTSFVPGVEKVGTDQARIRNSVYSSPGYTLDLSLENDELDIIRARIYDQWLYRLQIISSKLEKCN